MATSHGHRQLHDRLGSSSGSQAGTLNKTQVERRGAQFISARGRLDSNDSSFDTGTGRRSPSGLKRIAKSQDRLNSTSSLGGSRGNLSQQKLNQSVGNINAGYNTGGRGNTNTSSLPSPEQQQYQQHQQQHQPQDQGNSPNYSNLPNYSNVGINNNYEKRSLVSNNRDSRTSTSSVHSQGSARPHSKPGPTTAAANSMFHDFEKVRLDHLRKGKMHEDTVFVPSNNSLYYSRHPPYNFEWMRATNIARLYRQAPMFFAKGIDKFDVRQGKLGGCWLVAAMACLSSPEHRSLFDRVVPPGQSFQDGWYTGVFRFNFWHFGKWCQVLVDDFLPTIDGRLAFVSSTQDNEFWAALLEKAYAKLYGSYEALKGGLMRDSFTDLTGGLTESYTFHGPQANLPNNIVNILFKALERQSLIGCCINNKGTGQNVLPIGLVEGHAYSVTDLRRILNGQQPVSLIRIRNPHGDGKEWRGRWSDWSEEWQQISPQDRERLGLVKRDNGEFWMDFVEFVQNFDALEICNLTPDSLVDVQRKWHTVEHHGRWIKGYNAGGRPTSSAHWANPQYFLRLEDTDEDEDNVCSVLVQLMQKDRRKLKQKGENFYYIGFTVYQYEKGNSLPLKKDYFEYHNATASSGSFTNSRQVTRRLALPPGEYVIVPSTWDKDEEADYYMRFFFEKGHIAEYCDEKPEKVEIQPPTPSPEWKEQEESFKNFFYKVSGEDMELNAFELRNAINEHLKRDALQDISIDACRSFINLMDVDGSGRLAFFEFQYLWHHIRNWKRIYQQCDHNKSGLMESRELRGAMNVVGYKVSHRTITNLIFRYADEHGRINLDNFLALMARLMKAYNSFNELQKNETASLNLEQWLDSTLTL